MRKKVRLSEKLLRMVKFDSLSNFELIMFKSALLLISALFLPKAVVAEIKSVIFVFNN